MHIKTPIQAQLLLDLHCEAEDLHISPPRCRMLTELLDLLSQGGSKQISMLKSTAEHLSAGLAKPLSEIELRDLTSVGSVLKKYLKDRRFKRNSIRSYANYVRILIKEAKKVGALSVPSEIGDSWKKLSAEIAKRRGAAGFMRFAIDRSKPPEMITEEDLELYGEEMLRLGKSYGYVRNLKAYLRGIGFPHLQPRQRAAYSLRLAQFPNPLRQEVEDLIRWKTAPFSAGRPASGRHRNSTSNNFVAFLCGLTGFLFKVRGRTASNLKELITKDNVTDFVTWCINDRGVCPSSLIPRLGMLLAAARRYPGLQPAEFEWMKQLIDELPQGNVRTKETKEKKWVDHKQLRKIPELIRQDRSKQCSHVNHKKVDATLVRDELLMQWMTILPWRQRNIRLCKLASKEANGNLFKAEIPSFSTLATPKWVDEQRKSNPKAEFWQFYFRADETKTGQVVQSLLPRQLVPILEEYLRLRPLLVKGEDPGVLFVNLRGHAFNSMGLGDLVAKLTVRYAGRRVTPHLFRDIFAHRWLQDNPEDYLTLSKILWHRNLNTTLQIYGRNFDDPMLYDERSNG
jgi:hypothetical protein